MSETAGHGQSPLHGRLQTAVNLTNVSALLWRLDTLGCDIGDRWREVAALWEGHAEGKCLVFTDITPRWPSSLGPGSAGRAAARGDARDGGQRP